MSRKKIVLALGILSMNLLLMTGSVIGSAIAAIAKSFPHETIAKVQMVSSISQLGQLVATIFFTWLTYILTRKNIGLIAVLLVGVSGIIPLIHPNSLNLILACMAVLGCGTGLISNVSPVLLQEHFVDEDRASVMGWSVGFNNIGMMVFTALGGILGGSNWRNLFWVYGLAFIVLLIVWILVPQDSGIKVNVDDQREKQSFGTIIKNINGYTYVIILLTFLTSLALMIFMSNQSLVLQSQHRGTAYVAIITSIGNIGGILTGFGLKYIRKLTKTDTLAYGFIAFALSYIFVMYFHNPAFHILGNMFSGMGVVMVNATIQFQLSVLANEKQFPVVISLNTLASSLAGMAAPILLAILHVSAGNASFIMATVMSLILAGLLLLTRFGKIIDKNKQPQETVVE
ncbi:MFS transporter [Bombilactobacillus thymidiniphilus]|uniref:MFS transporter n=1 Tax=Bombilactobacillus thymidiniphilus TaxID=2923363 RepID=A0ABY4PCQ4_9LACO|nr:MFS transporter [Bombilactobacillus thymidiniphilus]UQS83395.1 MFS transporter [Bombilactobacillus thymidiniphilus]